MQILQLDLVNVKSYAQASISFAPGTNAIFGHNGAGKSTVLEAIGFALFDHLQVSRTDFVREGEKTATVTVHVMGADERVYQVVRKCGSSNQVYVVDPELDERLAEGKSDTLAWLRDFLGVEEDTDLAALFRDAVGVPQGLLTSAFLLPAAPRRNIFNPLLRVDEYEQAWTALRDARSWLDKEIQLAETHIAGLTAEGKALPERRAQFVHLAEAITEGELQQEALSSEWIEVSQQRQALSEVKARLDDLERSSLRAEAEAQTLAARRDQAQEAVARAEQARKVVRDAETGHESYVAAQTALESLEAERVERDRLRSELDQVERKLARDEDQLANLAERLDAVAEAEADLALLRPQVEEQERMEMALDAARRNEERLIATRRSLSQEQERLARLRQRLDEVRKGLEEREEVAAQLVDARQLLAPMDARAIELAEALVARRAESELLMGQQQVAVDRLKQIERELRAEEAALRALDDRLLAARDGLERRARLEARVAALREELEKGEARRLALAGRGAAIETEMQQVLKQLEALKEAATGADGQPRCPVCEAPLTPEHQEELAAQGSFRLTELQAEMASIKRDQKAAARARHMHETELHAAEADLTNLPRPAEVEELHARRAAQQEAMQEREEVLAREQRAMADLQARHADLDAEVRTLGARHEALQIERTAAQQALQALERRLAALPRDDEAERLARDVEQQASGVVEAEREVAALADAPEEVGRLVGELEALGDPRGVARVAAAAAEKRPGLERQQAEAMTQRDALAAVGENLVRSVELHSGLDSRLSAAREEVRAHTSAHERYLRASGEAATLETRLAEAAALEVDYAAAAAALAETRARRDAVARECDLEELQRLGARTEALQAGLSALEGRLGEQRDRHEQARVEVERLEAVQRDRETARVAQVELQELRALLDHLRLVIRDAGPKITAALVGLISNGADLVYSEIMQAGEGPNPGARLHWTDDYDIMLRTQGRERTFQQLSGGEQMAAALAVRLALLRQISTVDVAFFDEPTANLDRERRSNLAAQILSVKGFSQLFVISHDDTFEQDTDHVVHIVKEDGQSRVAALVAE
jgi:DNA repair protein SbcC/Rad50